MKKFLSCLTLITPLMLMTLGTTAYAHTIKGSEPIMNKGVSPIELNQKKDDRQGFPGGLIGGGTRHTSNISIAD